MPRCRNTEERYTLSSLYTCRMLTIAAPRSLTTCHTWTATLLTTCRHTHRLLYNVNNITQPSVPCYNHCNTTQPRVPCYNHCNTTQPRVPCYNHCNTTPPRVPCYKHCKLPTQYTPPTGKRSWQWIKWIRSENLSIFLYMLYSNTHVREVFFPLPPQQHCISSPRTAAIMAANFTWTERESLAIVTPPLNIVLIRFPSKRHTKMRNSVVSIWCETCHHYSLSTRLAGQTPTHDHVGNRTPDL